MRINSKILIKISRWLHLIGFVWFIFRLITPIVFSLGMGHQLNGDEITDSALATVLVLLYFSGVWKFLHQKYSTRALLISGVILSVILSMLLIPEFSYSGWTPDTVFGVLFAGSWIVVLISRLVEKYI